MAQSVKIELVILNGNKYDSRVARDDADEYEEYRADSFKEALRNSLFQVFDDMISVGICWIQCSGSILPTKKELPVSLSDVIILDIEHMKIFTDRGYITFSFLKEKMNNISEALMLLVWKWLSHFSEDNYNGFRSCVVCGRVQRGKPTGQYIGGFHYGLGCVVHNDPLREIHAFPSDYCFNQNCFSHEIERMIDPAYQYTPPKEGENLEDLISKVVKKNHPVGAGVVKKDIE